jgi:hypothetical protein
MNHFDSRCEYIADIGLPEFTGIRIMMMPLVIGELSSVPDYLSVWKEVIHRLFLCDFFRFGTAEHLGKVGYLTIDEKEVGPGKTHRRAGLHVDGGAGRGWGGGSWGSRATGMLTVSNAVGCQAWNQGFYGEPGWEGDCEALRPQLKRSARVILQPEKVYWLSGLCVHESMEQSAPVKRQFVRLSLPSTCPWYEGYTENPLGVKPTGEILPRREFMNA